MDHIEKHKQVLDLFLLKEVPEYLILDYYTTIDSNELQDWINSNLKKEFNWSTGIGIIEATEKIVKEAINNGNL